MFRAYEKLTGLGKTEPEYAGRAALRSPGRGRTTQHGTGSRDGADAGVGDGNFILVRHPAGQNDVGAEGVRYQRRQGAAGEDGRRYTVPPPRFHTALAG